MIWLICNVRTAFTVHALVHALNAVLLCSAVSILWKTGPTKRWFEYLDTSSRPYSLTYSYLGGAVENVYMPGLSIISIWTSNPSRKLQSYSIKNIYIVVRSIVGSDYLYLLPDLALQLNQWSNRFNRTINFHIILN